MSVLNSKSFIYFLNNNKIIATVIATIISTYIMNISKSFTDDILLPIINRDTDGDGKKDIHKYENYTIKVSNIELRIGNFIIEILKFLLITYIMYFLSQVL